MNLYKNKKFIPKCLSEKNLDIFRDRYEKIKKSGLWKNNIDNNSLEKESLETFPKLVENKEDIQVVGRIIKTHNFKDIVFAIIQQEVDLIELKISQKVCSNIFQLWKMHIKVGDIIVATGTAKWSKHGKPQIELKKFNILNICGLINLSRRDAKTDNKPIYKDFIANPKKIEEFKLRSIVLKTIRKTLDDYGFEEQITPILTNSFYGGRSHPFITHSRHENQELYLRVTSEIAMKYLLVGGFSRVYEIGNSFRNETQDRNHLSTFTALEAYAPYTSFENMLIIAEKIINCIYSATRYYKKNQDHFEKIKVPDSGIARISVKEILLDVLDADITTEKGINKIASISKKKYPNTKYEKCSLISFVLTKFIYPILKEPTFIINLPNNGSPFIAPNEKNPSLLQRALLIINGLFLMEVFFSQRNPFLLLESLENQFYELPQKNIHRDYRDFIESIFCGMPPTSVIAMGIERLFMIITNKKDIRKVHMKV